MTEEAIAMELTGEEKNMVEVVLGHLAHDDEHKDPEGAESMRNLINAVKDDKALFPNDWHTVWVVMDNKGAIEFPAQPYDENRVSNSIMEKIEEAVGEIPEHYKEA